MIAITPMEEKILCVSPNSYQDWHKGFRRTMRLAPNNFIMVNV
ncbi:hypothetical protein [Flavobacterium soyae]|nr:hypothetical protein [Flavobacterium soyae]